MRLLLLAASCGLGFACNVSAQGVSNNIAGSMSQSGAANVGAGAAPAFPGSQMNGPDYRVQGRVQPGGVSPTAPYLTPEAQREADKAAQEKRDAAAAKPEPAPAK